MKKEQLLKKLLLMVFKSMILIQKNKKKNVKTKNFSYSIKVADFYYKDTAQMMVDRIKNEAQLRI